MQRSGIISCYIIFSAPNKNRDDSDINVNIDGNSMDQVISTKFLGIYIDQHLAWAEHIKIISNKIAKNHQENSAPFTNKNLIQFILYSCESVFYLWEYSLGIELRSRIDSRIK